MEAETKNVPSVAADIAIARSKWICDELQTTLITSLAPILGEELARRLLSNAYTSGYLDGASDMLRQLRDK